MSGSHWFFTVLLQHPYDFFMLLNIKDLPLIC